MPTISAFYGLLIQMFYRDHAPPHFHVRYAEYKAVIDIKNLALIDGKFAEPETDCPFGVTLWNGTLSK